MTSLFGKVFGKIITYIGFIVSVGGIVYNNIILVLVGGIMIVIGCIIHEENEV